MRSMIKLLLVMALFSSSIFAGDQPNGGYTPCTTDCPPCTEDCDPENGLMANESTVLSSVEDSNADLETIDILVVFAAEYYRMFL